FTLTRSSLAFPTRPSSDLDARMPAGCEEPEGQPGGAVAFPDLVSAPDGDAVVVPDGVQDLGLAFPGCDAERIPEECFRTLVPFRDRKSTRLNSSHVSISYA